jgi:uncharacterized protein (DUF58 family)
VLLEPELRARLDRLSLHARHRVRGFWAGRHRSKRQGESLDFADYREYHPGDDFRRIDYNLWARLGVVLIRLFEAEDELPLQVMVDTSKSMDFGTKLRTAQEIAAAISYLALASGERVRVATVPEPGRPPILGPWGRHPSAWPHMERWLEGLQAGGGTDLPSGARAMVAPTAFRGPVVLISDLLADGWIKSLDLLGAAGGGVVLHVLSPAELDPDLTGDLTLRDAETGAEVPVSMDEPAIARYRQRMDRFLTDAAARSRRNGLDYVLATATEGAAEKALFGLVAAGAVR